MHQPKPHGTFGAANEEDAAAAELLARRLTNFKSVSGLDSLKMARTLPSGAMAIAVDMGGVLRVIIQQPSIEPERLSVADGLAKTFIPMMFSGVINTGRVREGAALRFQVTDQTRNRLANYPTDASKRAPEYLELQRFVIEHSQRFGELIPSPPPSNWTVTQYDNLRPTWYSGAMAQVVQIVGGYGRQDFDKLPDRPLERARMALPDKVAKAIERELGNLRLPGYTGLPSKEGQIIYDYKYNETHGVGFDSKGKPWLVRINTSGVHAMPLPMIPATTTKAFREYIEEKADEELLWALDRFGGLPSGESFPSKSADFEAWRRAGVIIKVCDVGDFYQYLMYGSAMGWSMNDRGNEGFNTCYDFDDSTQVTSGYAYKLKISLGEAKSEGKLPPSFDLDDPQDAAALNSYLSKLYEGLDGSTATSLAIKYKLRRVPVGDILARAERAVRSSASVQAEVDYWNNLTVEPLASHSGNVSRVGSGQIAWKMPGFKFPEPFMQGCISFESLGRPLPGNELKKADTILAGYYVGDQLKVIKFFADDRTYKRDVEDNYEDCMIVGAWDRTITEGTTGLMGSFYTSDFDDREAAADTTTTINIVGRDLGYDSKPFFSYDDFFWRPGTLWRNRYFRHDTKTVTVTGYSRTVAVCMPYLARNAVLHARSDGYTGKKTNVSAGMYSVADPYTYRYWTNDFIFAWIGGVSGPQAAVPGYPKDGNPVWVVQENYAPGGCSDFADQGPWIPALPADYTWLIHPNRMEWQHSGGGGAPSINEYSDTKQEPGKTEQRLDLSILDTTLHVHNEPASTYFLESPDLYVGIFYRDAVKVTAGTCEYANVSEPNKTIAGARAFQGWSRMADHKSAHHFIGVING